MFNTIKTAALSGLVALGTLAAVPAHADSIYLGFGNNHHVFEIFVQRPLRYNLFVSLNNGLSNGGLDQIGTGSTRENLTKLAGHNLDRSLAGNFAGRLATHSVGDDANGQIGKLFDLDGVFVVFPVIAEQRALANIE